MHSGAFSSVRRETPVMGDPSFIRLWFLSLYMSGEELIWEAAMMIFWCDIASGEFAPARQWETSFPLLSLTRKIAPVVAVCITFSGAKLAGIVILQGRAQLPRNNPQFFSAIKMARPEGWIFSVKPCRRITSSPYLISTVKRLYATTETMIINI